MRIIKTLLIIIFMSFCANIFAIDNPKKPVAPSVSGESSETKGIGLTVTCTREDGKTHTGECLEFNNISVKNMIWEGNRDGRQSLKIDQIKSIIIKGYTTQKRTTNNLSMVYYTPYLFDITLKNDKTIENAIGKIPEINTFSVKEMRLTQKCYCYFVRYWLEDKGEFVHNGSTNYNEQPAVPNETIVRIDFADK